MADTNIYSFQFSQKIPEYDKIDTYVLRSTIDKYKDVLHALVVLLKDIQVNYSGRLENTSYAEFSRILLDQFDEKLQNLAKSGKVAKNLVQSIGNSFGQESVKRGVLDAISKNLTPYLRNLAALNLDDFMKDDTVVKSFMESLTYDTSVSLGKLAGRIVKLIDDRFMMGVSSIVSESYDKALKLSDELARDDEENRRRREQSKLQQLEDIISNPANRIILSANNKKFLERSKKRLDKIQMRGQKISKMGADNAKDILIGDLKRSTGRFNSMEFAWNSSIRWMHLQFWRFGQRRMEYMLSESKRLLKDAEEMGRTIGPSGFMSFFNKTVSIIILPIVYPLNKIISNMPTIRKIGMFTRGVAIGVKNVAKLGLKTIRGVVKLGVWTIRGIVGAAKGIILAPFKLIGKIRGFINRPMGKELMELLSGDEGAVFLATVSAFFKVFVIDYILENRGSIQQLIKDQIQKIKKKFIHAKDIFTKYVIDPWRGRLFHNKNWDLNEDREIISEYGDLRKMEYAEYKSKKNDRFYRYRSYMMAQSYGVIQMSLFINLKLKQFYDKIFPYEDQSELEKAKRDLKDLDPETGGHIKIVQMKTAKEYLGSYKTIISNYVTKLADELFKGKLDIWGSFSGNVENVGRALEDFKTSIVGDFLSFGTSLFSTAIGGLFGPLGAIGGGIIGIGLGEMAKYLYEHSTKKERADKFAIDFIENSSREQEELNRETSQRYIELQDSLRGSKNGKHLTDEEMRGRILQMVKSKSGDSERGKILQKTFMEYQILRARGGQTNAEEEYFVRLKGRIQNEMLDLQRWYNSGRPIDTVPTDYYIDSFSEPILNNGVEYVKIEIPKDENERKKRLWNIANCRYIVGKILWDLIEKMDSPQSGITLQDIANVQKKLYDDYFRDGKFVDQDIPTITNVEDKVPLLSYASNIIGRVKSRQDMLSRSKKMSPFGIYDETLYERKHDTAVLKKEFDVFNMSLKQRGIEPLKINFNDTENERFFSEAYPLDSSYSKFVVTGDAYKYDIVDLNSPDIPTGLKREIRAAIFKQKDTIRFRNAFLKLLRLNNVGFMTQSSLIYSLFQNHQDADIRWGIASNMFIRNISKLENGEIPLYVVLAALGQDWRFQDSVNKLINSNGEYIGNLASLNNGTPNSAMGNPTAVQSSVFKTENQSSGNLVLPELNSGGKSSGKSPNSGIQGDRQDAKIAKKLVSEATGPRVVIPRSEPPKKTETQKQLNLFLLRQPVINQEQMSHEYYNPR